MKIAWQKIIPLILILVVLGTTYFLYQRGMISFWPKKENSKVRENSTVQMPISEKKITLSYKNKIGSAFDIANFEEGEDWYGNGDFDHSVYYEGSSSLFLTSLDGQKASANLNKKFSVIEVKNFKFLVYLATDPADIEEFNLVFNGKNFSYWFPIRDVQRGWNLLVLPKENFSFLPLAEGSQGNSAETPPTAEGNNIQEVVIELASRPKTRSTVNLDSLWTEKDDDYLKDWNANSDNFLSLKENQGGVGLLAVGFFSQQATLKNGSAKDYSFQAEFIPKRGGEFGLFLRGDYQSRYGYYLIMNGVKTNNWRIYKSGNFDGKDQILDLAKGEIGNFKIEKEKPYWLKAELRESKIAFSLSVDGQNFTRLGETDDDSFTAGGVGVTVQEGGMVLIDNLQFVQ